MRIFTKDLWLTLLMAVVVFMLLGTPALAKDYDGHWAATNIEKTYEHGWVNKDDTFRPDDSITRGEFADMLWRALGSPAPKAACPFSDVPEDAFYRQAVTGLYEDGIIKGYGNNTFGPLDSLTREQGFTLLSRAFKLTAAKPDSYKGFADWNDVSAWAIEPLSAMTELGYVEGVGNNNCAPQKALTRAEMVTLLLRVVDGTTNELEQVDVPLADVPVTPAVSGGSGNGNGGNNDGPTPSVTAPGVPQNLMATADNGQVTLNWSAPASNGGSAIIRYELSLDNGATWAGIGNDTSYTSIGLNNGTSYTFMVRAVNSVGASSTATVQATPVAPSPTDTFTVSAALLPGQKDFGNLAENASITKKTGDKVTEAEMNALVSAKSGYMFVGWYTNTDLQNLQPASFPVEAGTTLYARFNGNGTDNSIEIYTAQELQAINSGLDKSYVLMADINITGSWTPIGNINMNSFEGTLDGNGHTLTFGAEQSTAEQSTVDFAGEYASLFGYIGENGSVGSLMLKAADLCGIHAASLAYWNSGAIAYCIATGNVSNDPGTVEQICAGLVAVNTGTITNCNFKGALNGLGTAGGLVGDNRGNIIGCYVEGIIGSSGGVGGIVGENSGDITNSHFYGSVRSNNSSLMGGLVGKNYDRVVNCYTDGKVAALAGDDGVIAGGLAGENAGIIINCYVTGDVSATRYNSESFVGGLVGENEGSIVSCYAAGDTAFYGDSGAVGGLVGHNKNNISNSVALNTRIIGNSANSGRISGIDNGGKAKSNYANSDMKVAGEKVSGTLTDKNGENVDWASFNFIDWWASHFLAPVWGNSDTTPWQWGGDEYSLPILYWQEIPEAPAPKIIGVVTDIHSVQRWDGLGFIEQYEKITIFDREGKEVTYVFAKDFRNGYNALLNSNSGADGSNDQPYPYFSEDGNDTSIHWDYCKNTIGETIKELTAGDIVELVIDEDDKVVKIANYATFEASGVTASIEPGQNDTNRIIVTNTPALKTDGAYTLNKHAVVFNVTLDEYGNYYKTDIVTVANVLAGDTIARKVVPFDMKYGFDATALYIVGDMNSYSFGVISGQGRGDTGAYYTINGNRVYSDGLHAETIPSVIAYTLSDGVASIEYYLTEGTGADARCVTSVNGKTVPEFVQAISNVSYFAAVGYVPANGYSSSTGLLNVAGTSVFIDNYTYRYDIVDDNTCDAVDLRSRYVLAVYDKNGDALFVAAVGSDEPATVAVQAAAEDVESVGTAAIDVTATAGGTARHNSEQGDIFTIGDTVTLTALADEGFMFLGWQDENGGIVSAEAEYSFVAECDTMLTAVFAAMEPDWTESLTKDGDVIITELN